MALRRPAAALRALGTYVYVATRDPADLAARAGGSPRRCWPRSTGPAAGSATTPTWPGQRARRATGSRSTRSWSPPWPSPSRRPAATDGLVAPAAGPPRWSPAATTATSAALADDGAASRRRRARPRRLGADRARPTTRSGSRRGTALDLGATGKAFAADLVAATLAGELRALRHGQRRRRPRASSRPDGDPWPVAVSERPDEPGVELVWLDRRRPGHLEHPGPPLDARRRARTTTCSTRAPAARPTGRLAHRDRRRRHLRRRQHRQHRGDRARRTTPRPGSTGARRHRPAGRPPTARASAPAAGRPTRARPA